MAKNGYIPQLDAVRAFAVGAVLWSHWTPWQLGLPWGPMGVQLFFVLSGFLITGLLLDSRDEIDRSGGAITRGFVARNFFARRVLRLFPLYYLVVALGIVFDVASLRRSYPWHLGYCSNYCFIVHGGWDGVISHFWTLAVEEQFYLFWPALVLFLPRRWLFRGFLAVAGLGIAFRLVVLRWPDVPLLWIATPGQFHALALGAMLAWLTRHPTTWWSRVAACPGRWLAASSALFLALFLCSANPFANLAWQVVLCGIFVLLVATVPRIERGWIGWLLNNRVLCYLGRISYGLYLCHNFAAYPANLIFRVAPPLAHLHGATYLAKAGSTLALATLSWHLLERPILRLKRLFPYRGGEPAPAPRALANAPVA